MPSNVQSTTPRKARLTTLVRLKTVLAKTCGLTGQGMLSMLVLLYRLQTVGIPKFQGTITTRAKVLVILLNSCGKGVKSWGLGLGKLEIESILLEWLFIILLGTGLGRIRRMF